MAWKGSSSAARSTRGGCAYDASPLPDAEDFDKYGEDLQGAVWRLEIVEVQDVKERLELIRSEEFLTDLRPRIQTVSKLVREGNSIPPLMLRGKDHLIFDGYARLYALRALGVKKCLAYVGR